MTNISSNPKPARLTDSQMSVLSAAAALKGGGVVIPDRLRGKAAQSLADSLIHKGLAREVRAKTGMPVWRRDSESGKAFALVITKLGRAMVPEGTPPIPAGNGSAVDEVDQGKKIDRFADEPQRPHAPRPGSKLAGVIALLSHDTGVSMEELVAATGWLPHTTRAALTGLRRRGYVIWRERPEGKETAYRIPGVPGARAA